MGGALAGLPVKSRATAADCPDMGEATVAAPDARQAHRWAADVRALRAAIRAAKDAGRLSRSLGPPEPIAASFASLLDEVDHLPTGGPVEALSGLSSPGFGAWAHFFRVVRVWSTALVRDGVIAYQPCPDAAGFESWLLSHAEASDGHPN